MAGRLKKIVGCLKVSPKEGAGLLAFAEKEPSDGYESVVSLHGSSVYHRS